MKCPFSDAEMRRFHQQNFLYPTCPCPDDPECDCSVASIFPDPDEQDDY